MASFAFIFFMRQPPEPFFSRQNDTTSAAEINHTERKPNLDLYRINKWEKFGPRQIGIINELMLREAAAQKCEAGHESRSLINDRKRVQRIDIS